MKRSIFKRIAEWLIVPYYRALNRDMKRSYRVLDVGCGANGVMQHIIKRPRFAIGIEGDRDARKKAVLSGCYNSVHFGMIEDMFFKLSKRDFDVVLLSDIVEHFKKKDAYRIMKHAEKLGRKIIIFTPLGYLEQGAYDGNALQAHRSGWMPEDFRSLGYDVRVIQNFSTKSIYAVKVVP